MEENKNSMEEVNEEIENNINIEDKNFADNSTESKNDKEQNLEDNDEVVFEAVDDTDEVLGGKIESIDETSGIQISNDAVSTYAGIAVAEVKGVYGKGGTFSEITEALSGKKNYTKGIKVDVDNNTVKIDVSVIVIYGARIPDVAFEIQSKVKKTVENMTGLKVTEVNVNVVGIHQVEEENDSTYEEM